MKNHVKLFAVLCLLMLSVSCEQRYQRASSLTGNVLLKHNAVHKVLEELSHAQAAEAIIEEKARVQRIVAQEAKKAYERDTGEEMVQMVNAKISSLRAEQALRKVMQAQEVMKKVDQEVFEAKIRNNELARSLIQVENELINAQIEYISNNNESGIFDEKSQNAGQDLLDVLSIRYLTDAPERLIPHYSLIIDETASKKLGPFQPNQVVIKQFPYNNYTLYQRPTNISDILNINLPNTETIINSIPKLNKNTIFNSSLYMIPGMSYKGSENEVPVSNPQLVQIAQDSDTYPIHESKSLSLDQNLDGFELNNSSFHVKKGKNIRNLSNEVLIPVPQLAQLIQEQDKVFSDLKSESENNILHSEPAVFLKPKKMISSASHQNIMFSDEHSRENKSETIRTLLPAVTNTNNFNNSVIKNKNTNILSNKFPEILSVNQQNQSNHVLANNLHQRFQPLFGTVTENSKKISHAKSNSENTSGRISQHYQNKPNNLVQPLNMLSPKIRETASIRKIKQSKSNKSPLLSLKLNKLYRNENVSTRMNSQDPINSNREKYFNITPLQKSFVKFRPYNLTNFLNSYENPVVNFIPKQLQSIPFRRNEQNGSLVRNNEDAKYIANINDAPKYYIYPLSTHNQSPVLDVSITNAPVWFPTLSLNYGQIFGLPKENGFIKKANNIPSSEIDVRDVLNDLRNRKYIKKWNI